jgi:hypothetical protein
LSGVVTSAAIVIGGGWAYWKFFRERLRWPRAEVEILLDECLLAPDCNLVSIRVKVKNAGQGLMQVDEMWVDLRQVLPLRSDTQEAIRSGGQYDVTTVKAEWPSIKELERKWTRGPAELEPGETECFSFDFFVDPAIEVVMVYAFVKNVAKKRGNRPLGWPIREYHELAAAQVAQSPTGAVA